MKFKRAVADRLHRRAADGFGNGEIGRIGVVLCDRAGGRVEVEIGLVKAVVVHDHGVLAARLNGGGAARIGQRRLIRVQLIVRHIDDRVLGQIGKAAAFNDGAHALKDDLPERIVIAEGRLADEAHARGNCDLAELRAGVQVPLADGDQAVRQRHGGQVFIPADRAVPELKQRVGQRQRCDRVHIAERVALDHVHGAVIERAGHGDVPARAAVAVRKSDAQ